MFFRSVPEDERIQPIEFELVTNGYGEKPIMARVRGLTSPVPISVLFRALGVESDRDIFEAILGREGSATEAEGGDAAVGVMEEALRDAYETALRPSLVANAGVWTIDSAYEMLTPLTPYKTQDHARFIILNNVLPGSGYSMRIKALNLARLVRNILGMMAGVLKHSDRESMTIKRVKVSGALLSDVFFEATQSLKKNFRDSLDRAFYFGPWKQTGNINEIINDSNVTRFADRSVITETLYKSFKGQWGGRNDTSGGIVQELNRISYVGFLSHLRRVVNPMSKDLKLTAPRRVHGSQWGFICPVESPDGASIGLIKNLAVGASVTAYRDPAQAIEALDGLESTRSIRELAMREAAVMAPVLVNGVWFFCTEDPWGVCESLRESRRKGQLDRYTSVSYDRVSNTVRVQTDGGRLTRPLALPDLITGRTGATSFQAALESGWVEFVDVLESDNAFVSQSVREFDPKRHTHSELHACAILSVYAMTHPLLDHNQSPRNVLSAAQVKQANGVFSTGYRFRSDASAFTLEYPQIPLVDTRLGRIAGTRSHPGGANAVVAVIANTGYGMEDAVILNKTSVQRGILRSVQHKSEVYREDAATDGSKDVASRLVFENGSGNTEDLDENGFPYPGSYVVQGKRLIGLMAERRETTEFAEDDTLLVAAPDSSAMTREDKSPTADASMVGSVVDHVLVSSTSGTADGLPARACRVRYRKERIPELGDKFSSRHAQKGVLGVMLPAEKMPYTSDGIVPDIVLNPHVFPTRMTVGHVIECVLAKSAVLSGEPVRLVQFEDAGLESASDTIRSKGYDALGDEVMYSAETGLPMASDIFVCPIFYCRLKHMSSEKVKARERGGVSALSHQPTGVTGPTRPLKIGEMESSCLLAHGQTSFVYEAIMDKSDDSSVWTDREGHPIAFNEQEGYFQGIVDPLETHFVKHEIPHTFNVMAHELGAIGIDVRLHHGAANPSTDPPMDTGSGTWAGLEWDEDDADEDGNPVPEPGGDMEPGTDVAFVADDGEDG